MWDTKGPGDKALLCLPVSILKKLPLGLVIQTPASEDSAVSSLVTAPASVHTRFFHLQWFFSAHSSYFP